MGIDHCVACDSGSSEKNTQWLYTQQLARSTKKNLSPFPEGCKSS